MFLSRFFIFYEKMARQCPYVTQSIQTASLMAVGDVISQLIVEKKTDSQINCYRPFKFGSVGLVLGPVLNKWYRILDIINNGNLKITLVKKIALDQLLFAPIALVCIMMAVAFVDGKNRKEIEIKLKQDYFHILLTNYKVWPLVQCVNFSVVPLYHRVLVTQLVAVGWNAYLSWKLNLKET